jgi:hypothetical protein
MATDVKHHGLLAEFDTPAACMQAAEKVREAGYSRWDVFSPFPVHGMDDAMGLKNSKVGWFTFLGGVTGYTTGMLMIWFMNAVDYAIPVGGKPMFSPMGAFPPAYELTILFGAFGSLGLNRLPMLHHPLLKNKRFKGVAHDKFYIVIETDDPKFAESETRQLLESAGSRHIELVEE